MALDLDEINRAYLDFLRLSDTERFNVSGLGGHPTSRLPGGEYGNAELLFMSPVTVNYSWESFNSFGLAYIKSLAWNLIRNFFAYGMLYFVFSVVVIKTMINYFPSYLPFGIPENQGTMLNGIIAPLIIHAVWATTQRHNTEWKKARDKFRRDNEYNKAMLEKWCALSDEEKEKAKRVH